MSKKIFIKIINEEISNFDFLGNDKQIKEQENVDLLRNEDLQKQFICDSLLNKRDKIKILNISDARIGGNWDSNNSEDANILTIEYNLKMEYVYSPDKEPIIFDLYFDSDNVRIGVNSWHNPGNNIDIAPEGDSWFDDFEWNDINVTVFTLDGDEIQFVAFEKAPPKIQMLFIREYTQGFINSQTLEIRTKEMRDKVQNVPYC